MKSKKTLIIILLLLIGFGAYCLWADKAISERELQIKSEKIPSDFDGYRIVHISDLHNAHFGKGNEKLLERIKAAKPDIIAVTGDIVDARRTNTVIALDFIKAALEIAPVYYVSGNHEFRIPQGKELIEDMPKKKRQPKPSDLTQFIIEKSIPQHPSPNTHHPLKVVYFPSCINQTMGQSKHGGKVHDLVDEVIQLMAKAGYEVIFPEGMERMCCGQIWESKGMLDIADRKSAELEAALWKASEEGKYPVLCAQSPCLHRMKKVIKKMELYEPAEFIMKYLVPRLDFHPIDRPIALHITCSTRQMGVADDLINLAKMCSTNVFLPEGVGCCGFAGDRGFTFPELNKYGLRKLRPQIEANHIEVGYSNSRTCEIGLETNTGIPYMSIVYLVNECTTAKQ